MDFTGRYLIPAPPMVVWTALHDPDVLGACLPGCQSLTRSGDDHFDATATVQIGPLKAPFKAAITLSESNPPHRCVVAVESQGGVAGSAQGEAEVLLTPQGDATTVTYTANATLGGKLAEIGESQIAAAAKQMADTFFTRFIAEVAPSPPSDAIDAETLAILPEPAAVTAAPMMNSDTRRDGLAPEVWVVGLIGVIVILLLLFGVTL